MFYNHYTGVKYRHYGNGLGKSREKAAAPGFEGLTDVDIEKY